jgi:hypothetical protein
MSMVKSERCHAMFCLVLWRHTVAAYRMISCLVSIYDIKSSYPIQSRLVHLIPSKQALQMRSSVGHQRDMQLALHSSARLYNALHVNTRLQHVMSHHVTSQHNTLQHLHGLHGYAHPEEEGPRVEHVSVQESACEVC